MHLNEDILALIFEFLQDASPTSLTHLRLLCKPLQQTVDRIIYRKVLLSHNIIHRLPSRCPFADPERYGPEKVMERMARYTRKVTIPPTLDRVAVTRFVAGLERLKSLMWLGT